MWVNHLVHGAYECSAVAVWMSLAAYLVKLCSVNVLCLLVCNLCVCADPVFEQSGSLPEQDHEFWAPPQNILPSISRCVHVCVCVCACKRMVCMCIWMHMCVCAYTYSIHTYIYLMYLCGVCYSVLTSDSCPAASCPAVLSCILDWYVITTALAIITLYIFKHPRKNQFCA